MFTVNSFIVIRFNCFAMDNVLSLVEDLNIIVHVVHGKHLFTSLVLIVSHEQTVGGGGYHNKTLIYVFIAMCSCSFCPKTILNIK